LVEDSVLDVGSAWADDRARFVCRRVAVTAVKVGGSVLSEGQGEGLAQLFVLVLQASDVLGCRLQAA
jgi:hypothetical protein